MNIRNLFLLAAMAASTCFNHVNAQSADEILNKHIDAMGGMDNWNKVNTLKISGSMSANGMEMGMTQTTVHNKAARMDMKIMGANAYTIITPTQGWSCTPMFSGSDKPNELPADQLKAGQDKLDVKYGLLLNKSQITKAEYQGMDTLDKVPCYKLKITIGDNDQTAYFDTKNYYMVRQEMTTKIMDQDQEITINFSDFQKQPEGIVYPMKWSMPQGDLIFKNIEVNKSVDESIFKPTASAETAPATPGK